MYYNRKHFTYYFKVFKYYRNRIDVSFRYCFLFCNSLHNTDFRLTFTLFLVYCLPVRHLRFYGLVLINYICWIGFNGSVNKSRCPIVFFYLLHLSLFYCIYCTLYSWTDKNRLMLERRLNSIEPSKIFMPKWLAHCLQEKRSVFRTQTVVVGRCWVAMRTVCGLTVVLMCGLNALGRVLSMRQLSQPSTTISRWSLDDHWISKSMQI